jgi:hypothetical protein
LPEKKSNHDQESAEQCHRNAIALQRNATVDRLASRNLTNYVMLLHRSPLSFHGS